MKTDLLELLKSCKIFSSLDNKVLTDLLKKFKEVKIKKGTFLYKQGELSKSLYLLVKGKIAVFLKTEEHDNILINEILPGMLIGEMTALSHEPRSSTAKTVKTSTLLELPSDEFIKLCKKYNSISLEIINTTLSESRGIINKLTENPFIKQHIAIMPANDKINFPVFCKNIIKYNPYKEVIFLREDDLKNKYKSEEKLSEYIDKSDKENKVIVYLIQQHDSVLVKLCFNLERVDMIYIVGTEDTNPTMSAEINKKIEINKYKIVPELILLHENGDKFPKTTSEWSKLTKFNLFHHIRIKNKDDWSRLLRFITGNAIGVVLGGGGLRCWAQLGALKALMKYHIPIDIIGGSSAGAIVAGYFAMYQSFENLADLRELSKQTRHSISLTNLTWPSGALFTGKGYTKQLQKIFKHIKIENLWLPCFCISTNLSNNKQIISRKGYLWKIIRSSTAVPLVFPPVVVNGHLHLDGGLLNNLPVDVMKKMVPSNCKIIAVELTHASEDTNHYHFPPILPFWKAMLAKFHIVYKNYKFPHLIDTFFKSLLAGAAAKQAECADKADILISPDLSAFRLLSVTKEDEDKLIKIGYTAAVEQIKKMKMDKKSHSK